MKVLNVSLNYHFPKHGKLNGPNDFQIRNERYDWLESRCHKAWWSTSTVAMIILSFLSSPCETILSSENKSVRSYRNLYQHLCSIFFIIMTTPAEFTELINWMVKYQLNGQTLAEWPNTSWMVKHQLNDQILTEWSNII